MTDLEARLILSLADGLDAADCGLRAAGCAAAALALDGLARQLSDLHQRVTALIPRDLWRRAGEARDRLAGAGGDDFILNPDDAPPGLRPPGR